jgi:hypothetical protein
MIMMMMMMMMTTTVTGHTKTDTEAKVEASYHPLDRLEDIIYDSLHAKNVTPYHAFDGVNHNDHSHHDSYFPPNHHRHNTNIPRKLHWIVLSHTHFQNW